MIYIVSWVDVVKTNILLVHVCSFIFTVKSYSQSNTHVIGWDHICKNILAFLRQKLTFSIKHLNHKTETSISSNESLQHLFIVLWHSEMIAYTYLIDKALLFVFSESASKHLSRKVKGHFCSEISNGLREMLFQVNRRR